MSRISPKALWMTMMINSHFKIGLRALKAIVYRIIIHGNPEISKVSKIEAISLLELLATVGVWTDTNAFATCAAIVRATGSWNAQFENSGLRASPTLQLAGAVTRQQ